MNAAAVTQPARATIVEEGFRHQVRLAVNNLEESAAIPDADNFIFGRIFCRFQEGRFCF